MRNKEKDRITRHAYYLAHKADFKQRDKKWRQAKGNAHLKFARGLGVSLREASALIQQSEDQSR